MSRHKLTIVGALLALLTLVSLLRTSPAIGFPRDEAVYFEASRRYGAWYAQLLREPAKAASQASRDQHFAFNREHPPLMKSAAGISARLLAEAPQPIKGRDPDAFAPDGGWFQVLPESAAMRLPAQLLAALGVWLLFAHASSRAGRRRGATALSTLSAGLLAAGSFIWLPRVAFHASLHCFDLPIAIAILAVALAYLRGRHSLRWSFITALLLGLAISIKHNALFVGLLMAVHHYGCLAMRRRRGDRVSKAQWLPPVLVLPALIAPLVLWLSWPWLWTHPVDRLVEYFEFHARHSYYNMEFLGSNYNRPPLPFAYPWVMTWATVPTAMLVLGIAGLFVGESSSAPSEASTAPDAGWLRAGLCPADAPAHEGALLGLFIVFPLLLISLPSIPIFGGTKHWLTAYPFMSLAVARAWAWGWEHLQRGPENVRATGPAWGLLLVLGPSAWATTHGHPHNLSQYAPMVGGARGAAQLGLNRGFWGYAALPLFDRQADVEGRVYLHDMMSLAEYQYRREGSWPNGWRPSDAERAEAGFIFHERHMLSDEIRLWHADVPGAPSDQILLDDVPLTSWYGP